MRSRAHSQNPANIRSWHRLKSIAARLKFSDPNNRLRPTVIAKFIYNSVHLPTTVPSVTAICSVKPDFEDFPINCVNSSVSWFPHVVNVFRLAVVGIDSDPPRRNYRFRISKAILHHRHPPVLLIKFSFPSSKGLFSPNARYRQKAKYKSHSWCLRWLISPFIPASEAILAHWRTSNFSLDFKLLGFLSSPNPPLPIQKKVFIIEMDKAIVFPNSCQAICRASGIGQDRSGGAGLFLWQNERRKEG